MILYKNEVLKQASGLDYWMIKFGLAHIPTYKCQDIGDFLENQEKLRVMEEVIFPRLRYFPQERTDSELCVISLQDDERRRMDVYVRQSTYDEKTGKRLCEMLSRVNGGEVIYDIIISNGTIKLDESWEEAHHDKRVYLESFVSKRTKKARRKGLRELLAEVMQEFETPIPEMVPIRK